MDILEDVEFEVAKLVLGPGDILAVRVARSVTSVLAAELRSRLERQLGLSGRVIILEPGAELTVLTSADPAAKASVPSDSKFDGGRRGGK